MLLNVSVRVIVILLSVDYWLRSNPEICLNLPLSLSLSMITVMDTSDGNPSNLALGAINRLALIT